MKAPVSERALTQRISRKLATQGKKLCKARGVAEWNSWAGHYYIVETYNYNIVDHSFGAERLAYLGRELGCLQPYEELER